MKFTLPIQTKNPNNKREHWRPVAARAKAQRVATHLMMRATAGIPAARIIWLEKGGVTVTMTRVGPRDLDTDGLAASLKACRDGVADGLKLENDNDPRISWLYAQRRGPYAVEIEITERKHCPACGQVKP